MTLTCLRNHCISNTTEFPDFLAYQIRISANYTGASKSYLTHPYPSRGKDKIENFHVFDIHWLYRPPRYAIVKVDATKRNDVTKTSQ